MHSTTSQQGNASAFLIGALALILIGGGIVFYMSQTESEKTLMAEKDNEAMMEQDSSTANESMEDTAKADENESMMEEGDAMMVDYSGEILAGSSTKLIEYNEADFEVATAANKTIVLYFFANWCPTCAEEFPKMQSAFDELTSDNIVGFRVNFNDNETSQAEKELARTHGVPYQHTKVIIKDGEQVLKTPESWEKDKYLTEIRNIVTE